MHGEESEGTSTIESLPAPAMLLPTLVETYLPSASNSSIMFRCHVKISRAPEPQNFNILGPQGP